MTSISDVFAAGLEQVRRSWGWFLVSGILLMLLGAVCVVKAQTATSFSILALGWVLAISGVVWLVNSFFAFSWHGFFLYLLNGLIRCVAGYLLISHPVAGAEGVTMVLAALFIVGGLFRTIGSSVIQFPKWAWVMFAGLVSVALASTFWRLGVQPASFSLAWRSASISSLMAPLLQDSRERFTACPKRNKPELHDGDRAGAILNVAPTFRSGAQLVKARTDRPFGDRIRNRGRCASCRRHVWPHLGCALKRLQKR